jgi:hypothetical protein
LHHADFAFLATALEDLEHGVGRNAPNIVLRALEQVDARGLVDGRGIALCQEIS